MDKDKHVLIADDHPIVRKVVRTMFESNGFDVSDASNGAEAVQKAQQIKPDLIVLDLAMPVMNGLDTARTLKEILPDTPLVMFTNYAGSTVEDEAKAAGFSAMVSKSDANYELLTQINELLH